MTRNEIIEAMNLGKTLHYETKHVKVLRTPTIPMQFVYLFLPSMEYIPIKTIDETKYFVA